MRFRPDDLSAADVSVGIDVRPWSDHNRICPFSRLLIPVALLGLDEFGVADADVTTRAFGPNGAEPAFDLADPWVFLFSHWDVNHDGEKDLLSYSLAGRDRNRHGGRGGLPHWRNAGRHAHRQLRWHHGSARLRPRLRGCPCGAAARVDGRTDAASPAVAAGRRVFGRASRSERKAEGYLLRRPDEGSSLPDPDAPR